MENFKRGRSKWQMLELGDGITTSNGNWYHITRDGIEEYLPGLLKEYPLDRIIQEADSWVKSSDGFSLMLFFVLAYFTVTPWLAALISLVFYFFWYFNTSVFVNVTLTPIAKTLSADGFVYTVSGIFLIGISLNDAIPNNWFNVEFSALWYGIVLFFLYKVGLLRLLIQFFRNRFFEKPGVSKQDRVLNMLLIRYGMKAGIMTGKIKDMEHELLRVANYHKQKKNKKK
jgi:hypothetical protein